MIQDFKTTGRWVFILLLLGLLHLLMDFRYRIVGLFPAKATGFAVLAFAYAAIALLLVVWKPRVGSLFARLEAWADDAFSPLFRNGRPWRTLLIGAVILVMTLAGCLLRWIYIARTPIAPQYADMLPLIQGACKALLSGANPYAGVYQMPWPLPLTFWPGLWMPYLIPHVLGVDLRWVHIGVIVMVASLFAGLLLRARCSPSRENQAFVLASFAGLVLFLFSTELIFFANIAHTPPQWLWMALLAAAILTKRPVLSAVLLGLVLATRQTTVVLAPLLALYWLRSSGSLRTAITLSAVTSGTFLLICGPFLALDPVNFIAAPLRHYAELGRWDFAKGAGSFSADTIGFAYMLRSTQVGWLLPLASVLAILAPLALAWRRLRTETDTLLFMGFAGVAVALTAPIPWHYEYFPSLILFSFAALSAAKDSPHEFSKRAPDS
jgi:hypothetical protein